MKSDRDHGDFLDDILEHAEAAIEFTRLLPDATALAQDRRTLWAVIRALEVIGEAAKHIGEDFRRNHPTVPWRGMTGMRDKVIHDYFGVDAEVVWQTVKEDLPPLCTTLRKIRTDLEPR